jgi:hypothetical protein
MPPDSTYKPDFFDRTGDQLRCRICLVVIDFSSESGRSPEYLDKHVGEALGCPACGLASRIPSTDESEWPDRKHVHDPMHGVPMVER